MTATRAYRRPARATPDADYAALLAEFPLRPIRDAREYEAAAAILDRLAVRPESGRGAPSRGERDYFDTLTLLVERYDDEHARAATADLTPLQALRFLMAEHGMRTVDLGNVLGGNRALASLILNGKRALSKTHIRILAEYFKVEPGLFLGTRATKGR